MMEFVSWDDDYSILFPIYGKISHMFQTTNQLLMMSNGD